MGAPESPVVRAEIRVRGRVQGVGFRFFTVREAQRRGIRGWVRNEWDGSVRIVAEGKKEDLEAFLEAVRRGPPLARVEEMEVRWSRQLEGFPDFGIRYA